MAPKKETEGPLGILGGTFDPVHTAHLRLAEEAMAQLHLAGVLWIPAGLPSHRAAPVAAACDRLAMVRLATAGRPEYLIDEAEIASGAPSYTVPTLERLRTLHGDKQPLVLLMGADAFLGLTGWRRWRELFRLAHVAIASRPGFELTTEAMAPELAEEFRRRRRSQFTAIATAPAGAIVAFPLVAGTVSSTEVRAVLAADGDPARLLPAPVLDYIRSHRLYAQ